MEAFINKSTYLESNFGKDLLWVCQGTSAMRPMLHARAFRNGKCEWADFMDHQYFRIARQHGKAAAPASAASAQSALMRSLGAPKMGNADCELAEEPSNGKFRGMNQQLAFLDKPVKWPHANGNWIALDFSRSVCPWCLTVTEVSEHKCTPLLEKHMHQKLARSKAGTAAAVEVQKSGGSIEQQAAKYCETIHALVGTLPSRDIAWQNIYHLGCRLCRP